ncbi:MAG: hypothetical protein IKK85_08065 [Clostridia bacterium]|nr:hypothetical protein [Clostridia bacterium]
MKNTFKKLLSVILCAVLLFTTASTAFAAEDAQTEVLEKIYKCDYYSEYDIVVITYGNRYSVVGEIPKITIQSRSSEDDEIAEVFEVSEEKIQVKIFEWNDFYYPQIIINTDFCEKILSVEVAAGAFATADGDKSARLVIPASKVNDTKSFSITSRYDYVAFSETPADSEELIINFCAIEDRPIEVIIESAVGSYGACWLENSTFSYTVNGKTTEINLESFVPEEPGEYVIKLSLDGVFTEEMTIEVVSKEVAVKKSLKGATSRLKNFPLEFLTGLLAFIFVPGMGTFAGGAMMINSWEYVSDFFRALFGNPDYSTHIAKSSEGYEHSGAFKNL